MGSPDGSKKSATPPLEGQGRPGEKPDPAAAAAGERADKIRSENSRDDQVAVLRPKSAGGKIGSGAFTDKNVKSLEIQPAFKLDAERPDQNNGDKRKDGSKNGDRKDKGIREFEHKDPEALKRGREIFLPHLQERFKNDPALEKRLEAALGRIEKHLLAKHEKRADGSEVKQPDQLAQFYEDLERIHEHGYDLKDGNGRSIYGKDDIDKIIAGGIFDQDNQGKTLDCALSRVGKIMAKNGIGVKSRMVADLVTTGQFSNPDSQGRTTFTCSVDTESLRLGYEAQRQIYEQSVNGRDAYNQIASTGLAQLSLDWQGGKGHYLYTSTDSLAMRAGKQVVMHSEQVIDKTKNNTVISNSPMIDGKGESALIQAALGDYIDPNFGKEMVIVGRQQFDGAKNVTLVNNGKELYDQVNKDEAKDWEFPVVAIYAPRLEELKSEGLLAGNGRGHGWHAVGATTKVNGMALKPGELFLDNNWGQDFEGVLTADNFFRLTNAPEGAPAIDRQPGDHVFQPDGVYVKGGPSPIQTTDASKPEKDALSQTKKEQELDKEKELALANKDKRKNQENQALSVAQIDNELKRIQGDLDNCPPGDTRRATLMTEWQNYMYLKQKNLTA